MEKLKSFAIENHLKLDLVQYLIITSNEVSEYFINSYLNMNLNEKINFISELIKLPNILKNDHDFVTKIFKINLNIFCDSSNLDDAEKNSQLIYPFLPFLNVFLSLEDYSFLIDEIKQLEHKNYMNGVNKPIFECFKLNITRDAVRLNMILYPE
jgi:hypothetical protein